MTASEAIIGGLGARSVTSETLAKVSGLKLSTVRSTLTGMQYAGQVKVCGTIRLREVGRPANLYCRT